MMASRCLCRFSKHCEENMDVIDQLKQLALIIQLMISLGLSIESTSINGYSQQIFTLVADTVHGSRLIQTLSNDQVYGFETLTDMAVSESKAGYHEIGVNGMFYDSFGHPAGITIIDGEVVTSRNIGTPLFVIGKDGVPYLCDIELTLNLKINGKVYPVSEVNGQQPMTGFSIFTPWNGTSDRISALRKIIVINKFVVTRTVQTENPFATDQAPGGLVNGDFLAVILSSNDKDAIEVGDKVQVDYKSSIDLTDVSQGFQTGGWLVREGENVARPYENYIGSTDSMQPRTAIGIMKDNKVMIKVIDGRQSDLSLGVTGKQLAELFIQAGCIDAAYLDGGASSTLVKFGKLVNNPSLGEEKKISHGVFFDRDYTKVLAK